MSEFEGLFIGKGEGFLPRNYGAGPIEALTSICPTCAKSETLGAPTLEQWHVFWKMGDVNMDGYISGTDLNLINSALGTSNSAYDINEDGIVDVYDLAICAGNQGLNIWDYFGLPKPLDILPFILLGGGIALALILL